MQHQRAGSRFRVAVVAMFAAGVIGLSGQTQTPSPTPRPRSPEQVAYDAAIAIPDPGKRADALMALLDDAQFRAQPIARTAQNSLFTLLVTKLPDRTADIGSVLDAMMAALDGGPTPATPMGRLNTVITYATTLVDANVLLDRAAAIITPALAALTFDDYASSTRSSLERSKAANPNVRIPSDARLKLTFDANRGRGIELLGRIHAAQGNRDLAEREFRDAVAANPALYSTQLRLAQIDIQAGREASALDRYLSVSLSGHLNATDTGAMVALYKKVRGSVAGLDAELDTLYRAKFPNPITPEPYVPVPNRTTRVVLAELFTGSACVPCVAANLAMDALAEHYAAKDVAFLVYHANIPQPDPMVVAGGDARRTSYKVSGVPTLQVDGAVRVGGGGERDTAVDTYADYRKVIDKELAEPAAAEVRLTAARAGSAVKVSVRVAGLAAGVKDPRLHIVLAERALRFSGENGIRFHNMVVRAVAGEKAEDGSGFALTPGAAKTIDHVFDLAAIPADLTRTLADELARRRDTEATAGRAPADYRAEGNAMTAIDPAALCVVAYVQDADKKVLQAATVNLAPAVAVPAKR